MLFVICLLLRRCYAQTKSDFLKQLAASLSASSTLLQGGNNWCFLDLSTVADPAEVKINYSSPNLNSKKLYNNVIGYEFQKYRI